MQAAIAAGGGTDGDGKSYNVDTVSLSGTSVGTFDDKDVNDATTVSFSGLSLTGAGSDNYTLTPHASASHSTKEVGLSASRIYDGSKVLSGADVSITTGSILSYSGATSS